jgi:hypothetical protein
MTRYIPPFDLLKKRFLIANSADAKSVASIHFEDLLDVIRLLLQVVEVDEQWYLKTYPDIADAIEAGVISSAKSHFIENGYFEGRLPFLLEVDEAWYCAAYPDISEAINRGEIPSATRHFREFGYFEGRLAGSAG